MSIISRLFALLAEEGEVPGDVFPADLVEVLTTREDIEHYAALRRRNSIQDGSAGGDSRSNES